MTEIAQEGLSQTVVFQCPTCLTATPAGREFLGCEHCRDVLDVAPIDCQRTGPLDTARFQYRRLSHSVNERSGVWRFRELLPPFPLDAIVSLGEGNTPELRASGAAKWSGASNLWVKHLGYNPTGSYKDAGMTVAVSAAKRSGAQVVACASTGNTSASLATYAARAGLKAAVLLPDADVAQAKIAQTIDAGANVFRVAGNFDDAMAAVKSLALEGLVYLVNSINPFRREGQKTVAFEILEAREWRAPDWVVLPGGNLGNASALGKGFSEALALGLCDRLPRIAVVQASGASPFVSAWQRQGDLEPVAPQTIATAIKIGNPVSWRAAYRVLAKTCGTAIAVDDQSIAEARAVLARDGLGCEPASAASLAGVAALRARGDIAPDAEVVALLTGSNLKDVDHILKYHSSADEKLKNAPRTLRAEYGTLRQQFQELQG